MSLDDDQQYAENRDELLGRFRESLKKPMSERYFDEDDLIEIFDYAGDLNDDFLRMEALMCGARYFPESEALLERRGIFYSQYSDDAREQFIKNTDVSGNIILEILAVRNNPPQADEAPRILDRLLENYQSLSDEEVIQLIDLASSLDQWDWVKTNIETLRKKAQYLNVLLYECAIVAELAQDYAYGAQLLEELTEIEPFNSYFWMLLSRMYAQAEDHAKAMSAIDYSLAINPDSAPAILLKAKLLHSDEGSIKEIIRLAKQALKLAPDDLEILHFLSMVYQNSGAPEKAEALLLGALDRVPDSDNPDDRQRLYELIQEIVMLKPSSITHILDRFFKANDENSNLMWASWAQQMSMQGHPELAREIIECYERNSGTKIPSMFSVEDAFASQDFVSAVKGIEEYVSSIGSAETYFPSLMAVHLISALKTIGPEKALELASILQGVVDIGKFSALNTRLEYLGLMKIIEDIRSKHSRHASERTWKNYDPLNYWNTKA